jgi:hypothetical protein
MYVSLSLYHISTSKYVSKYLPTFKGLANNDTTSSKELPETKRKVIVIKL